MFGKKTNPLFGVKKMLKKVFVGASGEQFYLTGQAEMKQAFSLLEKEEDALLVILNPQKSTDVLDHALELAEQGHDISFVLPPETLIDIQKHPGHTGQALPAKSWQFNELHDDLKSFLDGIYPGTLSYNYVIITGEDRIVSRRTGYNFDITKMTLHDTSPISGKIKHIVKESGYSIFKKTDRTAQETAPKETIQDKPHSPSNPDGYTGNQAGLVI